MTAATKTSTATTLIEARKLVRQLRQHLGNAHAVMGQIIEKKAWEPLGYESFTALWDAELAEVSFVNDIRPQVVYQMFDEGVDDDTIASSVKGAGIETVKSLKSQRNNGVPVEQARPGERRGRKPGTGNTGVVHVVVGWEKLQEWREIAKDYDTTVEDKMLELATEWFESE